MNLRSFFYLQHSDRKVILFLAALILACLGLIIYTGSRMTETEVTDKDSASHPSPIPYQRQQLPTEPYTESGKDRKLFAFDPNTATPHQLQQLGLATYQIRNIIKYRAKGGIYRSPMDFARLYGLTRKQFRELEPYIAISDDYAPASTLASVQAYIAGKQAERQAAHKAYQAFKAKNTYKPYQEYDRDTIRYPLKLKAGEHINLATADTTLLKKVPGIGSGWARAIVSYGKRLGGYVAVGQLLEIDGFPEESLPFFSITNPNPAKLDLNSLTLNQLRKHPYLNFFQAREICDYRRLKGKLTSLSQLRLLKDFPPEAIERLRPYVDLR
ncbi:MAG: helix-hairpin-helix domain-containing protein [Prevotella sp.]|nr:helix-hairpin-helix domain-containing protein [Prevotella sp.]